MQLEPLSPTSLGKLAQHVPSEGGSVDDIVAVSYTHLDVSSLSYLSMLYLPYNKLTELTLPTECEELVALDIEGNQIRGEKMQALIDVYKRQAV